MSYTTHRTLQDLNDSFISSVAQISSLNSFYMIDESEINKLKNINYPACILEIPNSSINNINKAWEDYDLSLFILQPENSLASDYFSITYYDSAVAIFKELLSELMAQRNGDYVVDMSSIEIDRISNFGNDKNIGINVRMTLTMPSILARVSTDVVADPATITYTTNMMAYWSTLYRVERTDSSFNWNSYSNPTKHIQHIGTQPIPAFVGNKLKFSGITSPSANVEVLDSSQFTFSSANFSLFFKVYAPNEGGTTENTLFQFISDSEGDYYRVSIVSSGASEGQVKIFVDDSRGGNTTLNSVDSTPIGEPNNLEFFGIVNDASNEKTTLYVGTNSYDISIYRDDTISSNKFVLGGARLDFGDGFFSKGFEGRLSEVLIYDEAVSPTNVSTIRTNLG